MVDREQGPMVQVGLEMAAADCITEAGYGSGSVLGYVTQIEKHIDGAITGEDPEDVHKARTNSRRLRTALSVFRDIFDGAEEWILETKKMMKGLGKARDLDVRIIKLDQWLSLDENKRYYLVLKGMRDLYFDQRINEQEMVKASLNDAIRSGFLEEIRTSLIEFEQPAVKKGPYPFSLYKRARNDISGRVDGLKKLSDCVHVEEAYTKQHRLRIAAKNLRYSLALFSGIYAGGLSRELEALVRLQDSAGEMHDLDVWIEEIGKVLERSKDGGDGVFKGREDELNEFASHLKKRRDEEYSRFVEVWEGIDRDRILPELEETIRITMKLNSNVGRIAVISDVHANKHALEAVIRDAEGKGVEWFLNAGDIVGYGAYPNETVEICTGKHHVPISGNIDREVIGSDDEGEGLKWKALRYAKEELSKRNIRRLVELPDNRSIKVGDKDILLVHGSPDSPEEHLKASTPEKRFKEIVKKAPFDLIICGHTHEQFSKILKETLFLNPGSVGRNAEGTAYAQYALIDIDTLSFEMVNIDYDIWGAVRALRERDQPEEFARMILGGSVLKDVQSEEERLLHERSRIGTKDLESISLGYNQDLEHSKQVTKMSLMIFDALMRLHGLGERERWLLECGSLLHDIGWSIPEIPHHKGSMELILNDTRLTFTIKERYLIASIARYHRGSLPSKKHYNYRYLNEEDSVIMNKLASILRVADGLDCSHRSIVEDITVNILEDNVNMICLTEADPSLEDEKVNGSKKDLFEKVFRRELILKWDRT